ncbi:MAG: hypothetical protein HY655_11250 [Acidobacteria bacterium]|nr:hypothetical protein [Acidobacteriota bacterium]
MPPERRRQRGGRAGHPLGGGDAGAAEHPPVRLEPPVLQGRGYRHDDGKARPSDGRPEHELPFTPAGREAYLANKPTFGVTQVPPAMTNDPMQSPALDIPEQEYLPSETAKYNQLFGGPASGVGSIAR